MYTADSNGKRTVFKYSVLPSEIKMPFSIGAFPGHLLVLAVITPNLAHYYIINAHIHMVVIL